MRRKILVAVLIWVCGFGNNVFAQKENYVWYFGNQAGLDFNSGSPVALTNSAMYQWEGCATISDVNGYLLFYTNGIQVWDKNHNQMPNGDSLAGGQSSTQSALIVPFPNNNLLFYIFTMGEYQGPIDFHYSIINMSLNGGNGDVTIKNSFIGVPGTEKLTAVKHSNNNDIWVAVRDDNTNSFLVYLITSTGISLTPVISTIGSGFEPLGYMKFSADGSKLAYAGSAGNFVDLFDFNSTTGTITNEKYLTIPPPSGGWGAYGLEFSRSGKFILFT